MRVQGSVSKVAASWLAGAALATAGCGSKSPNPGAPGDAGGSGDAGAGTAITVRVFVDGEAATRNAPLVAFQDGDGAWMALTGTGGVYHATATGDRYGVAAGCNDPDGSLLVYYQSVREATELEASCAEAPSNTANITVNVLDADGRTSRVWLGDATGSRMGPGSLTLAVPRSQADVFAVSQIGDGSTVSDPRALRGITLAVDADASLAIDLAGALPLESHPLTIVDSLPADMVEDVAELTSMVRTPYSYGARVLFRDAVTQGLPVTTTTYRTPAAAMRQPGDILFAQAFVSSTTTAVEAIYDRSVTIATASPIPLTMTLPEILAAGAPTVDNAAIPHATATLPLRPATLGYGSSILNLFTSNDVTSRDVEVLVRPGWAQGQSTVTVTLPDLTGLPGWSAGMALLPDAPVSWNVISDDRNAPLETPIADGQTVMSSAVFGMIMRTAPVAGRTVDLASRAADARRRRLARLAR